MTGIRVVGLDPTSRGWVFAVVETGVGLVDHGSLCVRTVDEWHESAVSVAGRFDADALAIADPDRSHFHAASRDRLHLVRRIADTEGLRVVLVDVYAHRRKLGLATKWHTASHLASRYPELKDRLPRKRKPWMSEDWSMNLFDALLVAEGALRTLATPNIE